MPFTEFCCRSGGSNLNAGTRTGNSTVPGTAADFTYASGNWVAATGVFTVASGNPTSDGVAVGDFASVYADGSTVTGFVGRVTARDATTITVSLTAKHGTAPTDGTGNRTLKIGGAWAGPTTGATNFPNTSGLLSNAATNAAGDLPRVNYKTDRTYTFSTQLAAATGLTYAGFSSAYGDLAGLKQFAEWDGGAASITLFGSTNVTDVTLENLRLTSSASAGTGAGISLDGGSSARHAFFNVVVNGVRASAFSFQGTQHTIIECEAYNFGGAGGARHGLSVEGAAIVRRFTVHDMHVSSSGVGILLGVASVGTRVEDCVIDSCAGIGISVTVTSAGTITIANNDIYNNGGAGLSVNTSSALVLEIANNNFVKNGGYGMTLAGSGRKRGVFLNNAFGSGTQVNTSGQYDALGDLTALGTITYAADVTPWTDPANGDFRITLAAAKGAGRGSFTQTATSYGGTVAYPDVGAGQHQDAGGVSSPFGCAFIHGSHGEEAMSVRSAQSITVEFTTSSPTTQAAANADSTPAGTLVVNGTDNAAAVTVTNVDTGRYKCAVTLPTLAVGDVVELSVAATVGGVAGKRIVWRAAKDVVIDAAGLVDATAVKVGPTGAGTAQTARDLGGQLDAAVSTRLAAAGYTAPDNAGVAAIKARTDNLPVSPAAVGSPMTLQNGAITEASISTPAEAAGRPAGILGMMRRLFEWSANKKTRDRTTGQKKVYGADGSTVLETQVQSTGGTVDQETQGA